MHVFPVFTLDDLWLLSVSHQLDHSSSYHFYFGRLAVYYVILLIHAVPTVVSDRVTDIEKRRNLCPLSGTGAVAG